MDAWLREILVCPRDGGPLECTEHTLSCSAGHRFPIVDGVPVLLLDDVEQTHPVVQASIRRARGSPSGEAEDYFADTIGIDPDGRARLKTMPKSGVDPVVQLILRDTCGLLYEPLIGRLRCYPIPQLPLPPGSGEAFLDVGCSWGRWCIAAGRSGYSVVGIDPSLGAVLAARRVSSQLGVNARYVVADTRYLPFAAHSFDVVFSFSVLQHLSQENVRIALSEVARVMKPKGMSLIQMANRYGIRSLFHLAKGIFHDPGVFKVRYWSPAGLRKAFSQLIGPTVLSTHAFFGLGVLASDESLLPLRYRLVIRASELLRKVSERLPWLSTVADSVYLRSVREATSRQASQGHEALGALASSGSFRPSR